MVYKFEHLWTTWTEGGPENTRYNHSKSGWFDTTTFADWFEFSSILHSRALNGRKVIIGDNLSSHFSKRVMKLSEQNNITFICYLLIPLIYYSLWTWPFSSPRKEGGEKSWMLGNKIKEAISAAFQRCLSTTFETVVRRCMSVS